MSARSIRSLALVGLFSMVVALLLGLWGPVPLAAHSTAADDVGLLIPFASTPVKLDGDCGEYSDAVDESYPDANGVEGHVFLKHDADQLYVCVKVPAGSDQRRFETVYLDPQGDGSTYDFARQDDYGLKVGILNNDRTSLHGTGVANGYVADPGLDGLWSGVAQIHAEAETIEYSISLGRFKLGQCGALFGIAAYHHWVADVGDDYGWPANQFFDQPRTWKVAHLADAPCNSEQHGTIAYVFRGDTADATSFYNFLTAHGYTVTLVPVGDILTTDFSTFDLILVADDSGYLDTWQTATEAQHIRDGFRPIIGLGEGGYAFFGELSLYIGWPNGWHGPQDRVVRAPAAPPSIFSNPNVIPPDPVKVYSHPVNEIGVYLDPSGIPADVIPVGLEPPSSPTGAQSSRASMIFQNCYYLWGFSGNPTAMTGDGQNLFINTVEYMRVFQCGRPTTPPENCFTIKKSADPTNGTMVAPGSVIKYTIDYAYNNSLPGCENFKLPVKLVDTIPDDTIYVPNSASDGIAPGADGSLIWPIGAGTSGSKTFKVWVSDTQCHNQRTVVNRASLLIPDALPVTSNVVSHPVKCPPVAFPNDEPPYAETEVQIHPYPLITGNPSEISVMVSNLTGAPQTVAVEFQTSPNRFGIGLDFNTFASQTVTLPAYGNVIVRQMWTPVSSGHYCIQIKVQGAGFEPIYTQRNLDVTEDLKPGQPDDLVFKVRNNSNVTTDIALVVDNTCPGWNAVVTPSLLTNMAPGEVRDATLTVTPPNPVIFGSACHIDVQGWIGDHLIGGIRKLDVPPVHLPHDVQPSWLEPEISTIPDPLVLGQPGQICVELQNPLAFPRTVTLDYAVADFGAGIPFTTVATRTVTLPPTSNAKYCADWTPTGSNNLHRCILITLHQDGYIDQHSQRNIDLVKATPGQVGQIDVPFKVGNPDLIEQTLIFSPTIFGLDPFWHPIIVDDLGDPPPDVIEPGQILNLHLRLVPAMGRQALTDAPTRYTYGDETRIDVGVLQGGREMSGFSVQLEDPTNSLYLPLVLR